MSKILMTGATGLVGSVLLYRLVEAGHEVIAWSRRPQLLQAQVRWMVVDLLEDINRALRVLPTVDAVVHNAASLLIGKTEAERAELHKVNLESSRALLAWCVQCGVRVLLFTSTLSQLARPLPAVITEDAPVEPLTYYAQTKHLIEQALQELSDRHGIRTIICRIASPVSPRPQHMAQNVLRIWIDRALRGEDLTVFGSGMRTQDFVCVQDIAAAYEAVLHTSANGLYHIASGTTLSMLELANMIATHCGVGVHLQGEDVNEDERWNISINKAREDIGYAPAWTSRAVIISLLRHIRP